jgi:hypothetical protein
VTLILLFRSIGMYNVPATYVSITSVLCVTPPHFPFQNVSIEVSNNNLNFTDSRVPYRYLQCPTGHYCPDTYPIRCPPGSYCPDVGHVNYTLCPPGTYTPDQGNTGCTPCPRGFQCPDTGMSTPALCPLGLMCWRTGMVRGERCLRGYYCPPGIKTNDPNDLTCAAPPLLFCARCTHGVSAQRARPAADLRSGQVLYHRYRQRHDEQRRRHQAAELLPGLPVYALWQTKSVILPEVTCDLTLLRC